MLGKRRLKIVVFLVFTLLSVLLVTISASLTVKTVQKYEEKPMETANRPNDNTFSAKNDAETGSTSAAESGGTSPEGNSTGTDEAVPSVAPVETTSKQTTTQISGNGSASVNVPPPDGRVFLGGEEPYAYIPTSSSKAERLPILPLPDE